MGGTPGPLGVGGVTRTPAPPLWPSLASPQTAPPPPPPSLSPQKGSKGEAGGGNGIVGPRARRHAPAAAGAPSAHRDADAPRGADVGPKGELVAPLPPPHLLPAPPRPRPLLLWHPLLCRALLSSPPPHPRLLPRHPLLRYPSLTSLPTSLSARTPTRGPSPTAPSRISLPLLFPPPPTLPLESLISSLYLFLSPCDPVTPATLPLDPLWNPWTSEGGSSNQTLPPPTTRSFSPRSSGSNSKGLNLFFLFFCPAGEFELKVYLLVKK